MSDPVLNIARKAAVAVFFKAVCGPAKGHMVT